MAALPFFVLNPGGRDPDQDFPDYAGMPNERAHAPVNYHAYAAATGGAFLRSVKALQARGGRNVLLLLRSDLRQSLAVLRTLKEVNCRVWISFKESGLHQITAVLLKSGNGACFRNLCIEAEGVISCTADAVEFYRAAGATKVKFLPTPYPVDDSNWDFSIPREQRTGILVGTREFKIQSRNHAAAVLAALHLSTQTGESTTVINQDGRSGRKMLAELAAICPAGSLKILEGHRSYPDYLRLVARHSLVFQSDSSAVPGQVAGDALLCRIPCVGGNGTIERLVFPGLTGHGRDLGEIVALAKRLMEDPSCYLEHCTAAQKLASELLAFPQARERLTALLTDG